MYGENRLVPRAHHFLLAVITLETVSDATNAIFIDIGSTVSLLVIFLLPLYLLVQLVIIYHDEPDWSGQ